MTTGTQQNTHLLSALHAALPPERIATSAEAVAPYGGDRTGMWSAPEVVVSPLTAEEVAAVVRVAAHGRVPVVSRGAARDWRARRYPTGAAFCSI
jgi:FAD/FMN-containing dehydrogenase